MSGCFGKISVLKELPSGTDDKGNRSVFLFTGCPADHGPPLLCGGIRDVNGVPTLELVGPGFEGAFRFVRSGI